MTKRKGGVSVRGDWLPMSIVFLRSRACAELSPQAAKMLLDLCSQLGPNARGNGDLSAPPVTMRPRGWTSNATRQAALAELIEARLVVVTREGDRRRCRLFALTLWPMHCDFSKLEHGPGCYATSDWMQSGQRADPPSIDRPARWHSIRNGEKSQPAAGQRAVVVTPQRVEPTPSAGSYRPATGSQVPVSTPNVNPQRVTFLDTPSTALDKGPADSMSKPTAVDVGAPKKRPAAAGSRR